MSLPPVLFVKTLLVTALRLPCSLATALTVVVLVSWKLSVYLVELSSGVVPSVV